MDESEKKELYRAIQAEDSQEALRLIETYDVAALNDYRALVYAIKRGKDDIAMALIDKGVNVNLEDRATGMTAVELLGFQCAAPEILAQKLYECGAEKINQIYPRCTPLMLAVLQGDQDKVRDLLANGADVNAQDSNGNPVWYYALNNKNVEIFKELVNHGADLNVCNRKGDTALSYSILAYNGVCEAVDVCLEAGVDVDAGKNVPLASAIIARDDDMVKKLIDKGATIVGSPIENKFYVASVEMMSLLVDKGWDLCQPVRWGMGEFYPIEQCVIFNHGIDKVDFMLSKGADLNVVDSQGYTSLFYAVQSPETSWKEFGIRREEWSSPEFIQQLIDRGAKVTPEILEVAGNDDIKKVLEQALKKDKEVLKTEMKNQTHVSSYFQNKALKAATEVTLEKPAATATQEQDMSVILRNCYQDGR